MAAVVPRWEVLMKGSMPTNLPSDIMIDILLRLPVKSLLRFKCVCKPWCNLFGSPEFSKMHINQAIIKNSGCFLLKHLSDFGDEIYSLRSDKTFDEFGQLEVPVPSLTEFYQIVECSHGLICLTESNFKGSHSSLDTFLWNPAIREFRTLPRYRVNKLTCPLTVAAIGFAFHPEFNDYKVVRIVYFYSSKTYEVAVYSLSTDSWRKVNANIRGSIQCHLSRAFVNGALHWMASAKDENNSIQELILSFDVGANKVNEMILPNFGYNESEVQKSLAMFGGSLSVFIYNPFQLNESCDTWVMKEYGVMESWTKQYSFRKDIQFMIPLGFFDNGEFIMEKSDSELVLCDLNVTEVKSLQIFGPARIVKYTESLVSPRGGNRFVKNQDFYKISLLPFLQPSTRRRL